MHTGLYYLFSDLDKYGTAERVPGSGQPCATHTHTPGDTILKQMHLVLNK